MVTSLFYFYANSTNGLQRRRVNVIPEIIKRSILDVNNVGNKRLL